jgi:energy-coupling factor transporter ATP-binding protein EcfA2
VYCKIAVQNLEALSLAVIDEITKWASTELPPWQSDAVRRLLTQDSLSATDEQELLLMLKAPYGLLVSGGTSPTPQPLVPASIPGTQASSQRVTLLAMKDLTNVNAIPPGSRPLTFGDKGITIIYGDNASGKSGYARVLKKACRARHIEPIYPDVRAQAPTGPPSASFAISRNSQPEELQWVEGPDTHEILGNIYVFDSKCARIIIDEDNKVEYLPYGAGVFRDLATLCQKFKGSLETECPPLTLIDTADIPSATQAGMFLSTLNVKTTIDALNAATKWTPEDDKKLQDLNIEIAKATAEDPKKQALRLRNLRQRIQNLKEGLNNISSALSDESVAALNTKISQVKTAQRAFTLASQQSLPKEPLPSVEHNEWKDLYEAAKEYSTKIAYKDKDFPFIGPDSVCVLCMQPLSQQAKERFQRFKSFMEQTTKKHLETVEAELLTALKMLADLDFGILDSYKDAFDEISARNKPCADSMKPYVEKAMAKKMSMESAGQTLSAPLLIELPTCPVSDIESILVSMEQEATTLQNLAVPQKLSSLKSDMSELAARKKLIEIKPDILQYLSNLKLAALYDLCIKETGTTQITKRGREIVSAALTEQFKNLLNKELSEFGSQIQLTLEPHGTIGETFHKLHLSNCKLPKDAKVTDILSEGEQRIVSIASFLAELEACGHSNPVVFDDPVSSLDHNWRGRVADRLTCEAAKRQVIIFTHDIVFSTAVMYAANTANIPLTSRCIQRLGDNPGSTIDTIPWKAATVPQSIDALEKELSQICKTRQSKTAEEYAQVAQSFYSKMRATWENTIEQVAFQGTVRRFDAHVRINPNIMMVTVFDPEDCKTLLAAHKKCCNITESHSNIAVTNAPIPEPDEIAQDLRVLKDWVNNIRAKQEALKKSS